MTSGSTLPLLRRRSYFLKNASFNTVSTSKDTVETIIQQIKSLIRKQPLNKEIFTLAAYQIQFISVIPHIPTIFGIRALLNTGNILKSCLYDIPTLTVSLFSALTSIIPFNNAWQSGGIKWGIWNTPLFTFSRSCRRLSWSKGKAPWEKNAEETKRSKMTENYQIRTCKWVVYLLGYFNYRYKAMYYSSIPHTHYARFFF